MEMAKASKKVLVIYTGGTIGMEPSENGYVPVQGYLHNVFRSSSRLNNPILANELEVPFTLPDTFHSEFFVTYELLEYDPLMDSSNMSMDDWIKIATDIETNYSDFDAFVVLHGTDTMAYSASALSFMLKDLTKTVIITGSQIPISELRNDGISNVLGALLIAGNYEIPEVCIFFNNKLMRGNRSEKVSTSDLDAFQTPNYPTLVKLGVDIKVNWRSVLNPPSKPRFSVQKAMNRNIAILRLFPGITGKSLLNLTKGVKLEGIVLHTYGAGNAPMTKSFLDALGKLSDNNIVIVNCTQCQEGSVEAHYETGKILQKYGVVGGEDMTIEAAVAKLSYLLAQDLQTQTVKRRMSKSLRGELTEVKKTSFSFKDQSFIKSVANVLNSDTGEVKAALEPVLLCACAGLGDLSQIRAMIEDGADVNSQDYDGRTALHIASAEGHIPIIEYLLTQGADPHLEDRWGKSSIRDAELAENNAVLDLLNG